VSLVKTVWGLLFRLFPCPTAVGLRKVGNPGRDSPVLVTCNFDLTVKRVEAVLRRASQDAWLVVADSKGVNVWCAACADEFSTRTVVAAVKTSGIADEVDHRTLILPPLGATGILPEEVREQTGFSTRWGPVRAEDLPAYLGAGCTRDEPMKRVTYDWRERLDTALGSMFPFYLLGALGFVAFGRELLVDYLLIGALTFVVFMLACPHVPGRRGITKVLVLEVPLALGLIATELWPPGGAALRADWLIAMVTLAVWGSELGGLASNRSSDFDPLLARMGIGRLGNVYFAGTVRTELLNGHRALCHAREVCIGCRQCVEVCPQEVWEMDEDERAVLARREDCTACRACLVQCATEAITAPRTGAGKEQTAGEAGL
jgi:NAD-dependent dihydropyrimidine dehydrogenase PreA subunit